MDTSTLNPTKQLKGLKPNAIVTTTDSSTAAETNKSIGEQWQSLSKAARAFWQQYSTLIIGFTGPAVKPVWRYLSDLSVVELFCYAAISVLLTFVIQLIVAFAAFLDLILKLAALVVVVVCIAKLTKAGWRDLQDNLERYQS